MCSRCIPVACLFFPQFLMKLEGFGKFQADVPPTFIKSQPQESQESTKMAFPEVFVNLLHSVNTVTCFRSVI